MYVSGNLGAPGNYLQDQYSLFTVEFQSVSGSDLHAGGLPVWYCTNQTRKGELGKAAFH